MPDHTTELIDRYLAGTLDTQTRQQVESRLAGDAGFREEVDLQRRLMQQVRLYNRLELRRRLMVLDTEPGHPGTTVQDRMSLPFPVRPPSFARAYGWAAASMLILVLAGAYGLWQAGRPRPGAPPPGPTATCRIPLLDAPAGLGFGTPDMPPDSLVVRLTVSPADSTYVFATDTLVLRLKQPPASLAGWRVVHDAANGRYVLHAGTRRYALERGFAAPRPLKAY